MKEIIPNKFSAGLTFNRVATLTAYPAPDWVLSALLRGPSEIDFSAEPSGSGHRFVVSAAETAAWAPGRYWYSIRATRDGEVAEVDNGEIVIEPDFSTTAAGYDGRDHVRRVVDAIEAVLERRATLDQERFTINNRELWRTPIADLLVLRDRYRSELRRMNAVKRGGLFNQKVRVGFS